MVMTLVNQQQFIEELQRENERLRDQNRSLLIDRDSLLGTAKIATSTEEIVLRKERDQLAAWAARMQSATTSKIIDWVHCGMATNGRLKEQWALNEFNEFKQALKSTPAASLANVKARAVYDFAKESGVFNPEYDGQEYVEIPRYKVRGYVEELRQDAQKGGE